MCQKSTIRCRVIFGGPFFNSDKVSGLKSKIPVISILDHVLKYRPVQISALQVPEKGRANPDLCLKLASPHWLQCPKMEKNKMG